MSQTWRGWWLTVACAACAPMQSRAPAAAPRAGHTITVESVTPTPNPHTCEQHPSFTPDGSAVIYATFVDGGWGLMRYDLKTHKRSRVTMQNAQVWEYLESYDIAPAVSPDGKRVAYLHRTNQATELRVLPITGDGDTDPLVVARASTTQETAPMWTANDQVLFVAADGNPVEYRVGPPSVKLRTVAQPHEQVASVLQTPDRTLVARVRSLTNLNVWSFMLRRPDDAEWSYMPLEGGVNGPLMRGGLALSRDGKDLYHASGNTFDSARVVRRPIAAKPTAAEALPKIAHVTGGFDISADRRLLAYSECYEYSNLIRVRQGQPAAVILAATGSSFHVQPRRYGKDRLLFTSRHEGTSTVGVLDLKTQRATTLLDCDCEQATVSPDGRYVAYLKHTHPDAPGGLRLRPLEGGAAGAEIVLTQDATDRGPEWFHDSRHVVFKRGHGGNIDLLYLTSIGADAPAEPLSALGPVNLYATSTTEDLIVYTNPGNALSIATSHGRGVAPLSNKLGSGVIFNRLVFSPDGKRVLVLRGGRELLEVVLKGERDPALITDLGQTDTWYVDYAPDGDGVVVPLSVFRGSLVLARGEFP